jgi:putative endonuclease
MSAHLYILRLQSGQLYVGATTDLDRRWREHQSGEACRTTRLDPPRAIVYTEEFPSFADARGREAQIKRWSRAKREALVARDLDALQRLAQSHDPRSE